MTTNTTPDRRLVQGQRYDVSQLVFLGWTENSLEAPVLRVLGSADSGYRVEYYFDGDGAYLGPDEFGVEPIFEDPDGE
jgi:hypothetical protein